MAMGAMLSGALGVPLTAILFCLEVTHGYEAALPLVLCCTAAYLITSLIMPRSILTEKIGRRGYHLSREYGVDPLETVLVAEVMSSQPEAQPAPEKLPDVFAYTDQTCRAVAEEMATTGLLHLAVVDRDTDQIVGSIGAVELLAGRRRAVKRESERLIAFRSPLREEPSTSAEQTTV